MGGLTWDEDGRGCGRCPVVGADVFGCGVAVDFIWTKGECAGVNRCYVLSETAFDPVATVARTLPSFLLLILICGLH